MCCSIYHEPTLLCPLYFSLWKCIKEKDSFVKHSAQSLPSLQGGIRKTRTQTIFSPGNQWELGSQARRLRHCCSPNTPQKHPENWCDPSEPFVSTSMALSANTQTTRGCKALFWVKRMISLLRRAIIIYTQYLQQEGRLGAAATSTGCTGTAGISRSSWGCDLDWESETVWISDQSVLHRASWPKKFTVRF